MNRVFGSATIEPEGLVLDNDKFLDECPECKSQNAVHHHWQDASEGSINPYYRIKCPDCGHEETDWADYE